MKLFERTGGYYLFWTGAVYFLAGMFNIFVYKFDTVGLLQMFWVIALSLPFTCPPFGRWLNMDVTWDKNMFTWFGKKDKTPSNVVPFPEPKEVPKMPQVKPPKEEEKPAITFYRLGLTDNNRVSLQMGYSEITMNVNGVNNLIEQLELFRDQLQEEEIE